MWNVAVTEVFMHSAFQSIEKKAFQIRMKNHHGAVRKRSLEQQLLKSDKIAN